MEGRNNSELTKTKELLAKVENAKASVYTEMQFVIGLFFGLFFGVFGSLYTSIIYGEVISKWDKVSIFFLTVGLTVILVFAGLYCYNWWKKIYTLHKNLDSIGMLGQTIVLKMETKKE